MIYFFFWKKKITVIIKFSGHFTEKNLSINNLIDISANFINILNRWNATESRTEKPSPAPRRSKDG